MSAKSNFDVDLAALDSWLDSPLGRYDLAWQQMQYDRSVADFFGFHAVQIGLARFPALRESRMPLRVFCATPTEASFALPAQGFCEAVLRVERPEELPFDTGSLDLVLLPHLLEFAADPHQVLREVDRVLRPEGRVIVSGFNPVSLWGLRHGLLPALLKDFLPAPCKMLSVPRLRDWFKLLSFEMDRGRFGCYAPPTRSDSWLKRSAFLEKAGDRWWPICGAIYFVSAVKRVQGMRLVGPAWKRRSAAAPAGPVVVAPPTSTQDGISAATCRDDPARPAPNCSAPSSH